MAVPTSSLPHRVWVYGCNLDGTLFPVASHDTYGSIRSALSGYRAYETHRGEVENYLNSGKPIIAAWDGNSYAFSPYELNLDGTRKEVGA